VLKQRGSRGPTTPSWPAQGKTRSRPCACISRSKYGLFSAYRLAGRKHGQLVTVELDANARNFEQRFVPD
jgi:hypothetical protein